jgi:hypothetical protein
MKGSVLFAIISCAAFSWIGCKTPGSNTKALSDAISAPTQILPGLYTVQCRDGSTSYVTEADLDERDGERVCRSERMIYTLQDTIIASEDLNQKGNCRIPANTAIRLAKALERPNNASNAECQEWWDPSLLQVCRNFHITILDEPANRALVKRGVSPSSTETCHLISGKIFGPMATTDDIQTISNPSTRDQVKGPRFIYTDRQLGYPRLASYPSYPYQ